jgi:hypothetical protein
MSFTPSDLYTFGAKLKPSIGVYAFGNQNPEKKGVQGGTAPF